MKKNIKLIYNEFYGAINRTTNAGMFGIAEDASKRINDHNKKATHGTWEELFALRFKPGSAWKIEQSYKQEVKDNPKYKVSEGVSVQRANNASVEGYASNEVVRIPYLLDRICSSIALLSNIECIITDPHSYINKERRRHNLEPLPNENGEVLHFREENIPLF